MISTAHARRRYLLFALLGFCAATTYADHAPEPNPNFAVPRAELLSTIKTIGVMPVTVASVVPDADGVAARYESEIVARLTSAGFVVIAPSVMREIRERLKRTMGGLFDPMTGYPIKEKVEKYKESSDLEYLSSEMPDALLQAAIVARAADFGSEKVSWDGVTDSSSGRSGVGDFMMRMTGAGVGGQIPVLSLNVLLKNTDGKRLYAGTGGLQVLAYSRIAVEHMLSTVQSRQIDAKFIMTDPARDARALSIALDPLLLGTTPTSIKIASVPPANPNAAGVARSISHDEVLARFPRVALAPLELPDVWQREEVQVRFRAELTQKLAQFGFKVAGGDDYGRLWRAERAAVGGYFDPVSGRLDEAKVKDSFKRVFELMQDHLEATAVVIPKVAVRCAPFHAGVADWDGVKESLTPGKSKLGALFDPSMNYGGRMSAVSLEVKIIEPDGNVALEGTGGLQLIERFPGGGRRPLSEEDLLSDSAKDMRAIDIALATLDAPGRAVRSDCSGE